MTNSKSTIVKFHLSRGGRFNNPGYVRFVGESRIDEGSVFESLFLSEDETQYLDFNGNEVELSVKDAESGIGTINLDNEYDTTTTMYITDCSTNSLSVIARDNPYNVEDLILESGFFQDSSVISILIAFNKLEYAINEEYKKDTLLFVGVEEITEEEYDLYDAEYQEEVNGKFYKLV